MQNTERELELFKNDDVTLMLHVGKNGNTLVIGSHNEWCKSVHLSKGQAIEIGNKLIYHGLNMSKTFYHNELPTWTKYEQIHSNTYCFRASGITYYISIHDSIMIIDVFEKCARYEVSVPETIGDFIDICMKYGIEF